MCAGVDAQRVTLVESRLDACLVFVFFCFFFIAWVICLHSIGGWEYVDFVMLLIMLFAIQ